MKSEDCRECEKLSKTLPKEEVLKDHDNCHAWFHCGQECCGECNYCGN